jgi:hypothetical protein
MYIYVYYSRERFVLKTCYKNDLRKKGNVSYSKKDTKCI